MFKKTYLTPEDQKEWDPFGLNRKMLKRYNVSKQTFNPKSKLINGDGSLLLNRMKKIIQSKLDSQPNSKHNDYYNWSLEYEEKYGPQGGTFPFQIMVESYYRSYENAEYEPSYKYAIIGRDWLLRYINQLVDKYGYPQIIQPTIQRTNAALPTGLHKGDWLAETYMMKQHRHVYPTVPGQRYMRKKMRTINQDSILNVRYIESSLASVREWLKKYIPELFAAWRNPMTDIAPIATKIVNNNMYSVETDYEKMDEHFSESNTLELVLPIYDALLPFGEAMYLDTYVSEMFHQPIYFGTYILEGLHNLLSGQGPTSDFETLTQIEQSVGIMLEMGYDPLTVPQLHIGDDQVVAFKSLKDAQYFMETFINESNNNGLKINREKSCIRHGQVQFCRKLYYHGAPSCYNTNGELVYIGAYPSILCLNTIVNPEKTTKSDGVEAVAIYQKLDNCQGSPDFHELCQVVNRYSKFTNLEIDSDDPDVIKYITADWWFKVYGEVWQPLSSPSFRFLHNINL